jgi:peptide/nickel transport system substrate-binding protein
MNSTKHAMGPGHVSLGGGMTRRQLLGRTAAASAGVVFGPLCSSFAQSSGTGGKVTAAMYVDITTLDPAASVYIPGFLILKSVVETLVELDDKGEARPRLASEWKFSPDGRTLTFKLHEGIKFHDGTPFNADAVKFTLDRIQDPATKALTALSLLGPYKSSEVIDAKTIQIRFAEPYAPVFANFSHPVLGIVSPTAVKQAGADFGRKPVGTGPYAFKDWIRGDRVTLSRYDGYVNTSSLVGHKGLPYLDTVVVRFILDHQTRLAALLNGEIDFMFNVPAIDSVNLKRDSRVQVIETMFTGCPTVQHINRQLHPTNDLAVARAIQYAVNKEVIARIGTQGTSPPAWGPLKSSTWGYSPKVKSLYRYDPAKAKALLDEAGWVPGPNGIRAKAGKEARLVTHVKDDKIAVSELEAIQGMLRAVGLDLEIKVMSLAASEDMARQGKNNLSRTNWWGTDPDILTFFHHSKNIGGWNQAYFKNEECDRLLDLGRATLDPKKRLEIYEKVQLLVMEEAAVLPMYDWVTINAAKTTLQGVRFDATKYYPEWYDVTWKS